MEIRQRMKERSKQIVDKLKPDLSSVVLCIWVFPR